MTAQNINSCLILSYNDTLLSKNKLKKFILLNFLLVKLNNISPSNVITLSLHNTTKKHKNVFLQSPFHFKTVKTHLYIPTYTYSFKLLSCQNVLSKNQKVYLNALNMIGILHSTESRISVNYKI